MNDTLVVDGVPQTPNANITGGTIDGVDIGLKTPGPAELTTLGVNTTDPTGVAHIVLEAGKPMLIGGDTLATVTGVTGTDATPTVLTVSTTNGVAIGDGVIINSGTNATVGSYICTAVVVDTSVTLDRNASSGGAIASASVTYVNDPIIIEVQSGSGEPRIVLPTQSDTVTPTLAFGDGDTGIYESYDDTLRISQNGVDTWLFESNYFYGPSSAGPALYAITASNVTPNILPWKADSDTGIGHVTSAADQLSLIAGGVEGQRIIEANSVIYHLFGVTEQDSVTNGETDGTTTISSDGATGGDFVTTCQIGDAVLIWGGTTTADYGLYYITAVTDDDNLVLNTAPSGTNSDVDFYVFRNGRIETAERTWYLQNDTAAGTTPVIVGTIAEAGLEKRYTIGLDETARTMVICDAGDVDTDFGLGAESSPALKIYRENAANPLTISFSSIIFDSDGTISGRKLVFRGKLDAPTGDMFQFLSDNGIELDATTAVEQSWLFVEPKINQTHANSAYNGLKIQVNETDIGDGSSGEGGGTNNLILAGTTTDPDMFKVDNVGRVVLAESSDPAALADHAFLYAKDVGGTGNMFVADAAADATQISSHNFTLFEPEPDCLLYTSPSPRD